MDCTKLMSLHPETIQNNYNQCKEQVLNLSKKYPWQIISRLSHFKFNLENCLKDFDYGGKEGKLVVDFTNPLIKDPLLSLESFSLVPKHDDIFIEFVSDNPNDIHESLTKTSICKGEDQNLMKLFNKDKHILNLYSEHSMLDFINFIVSSSSNIPISAIVQNLKLPKLADFNLVIDGYKELQELLESIESDNQRTMTNLFTQQISQHD